MNFLRALHAWADSYFYRPNIFCKFIAILFLPLSLFYALIIWAKFWLNTRKKLKFNIPIISVGNLTLGGSGKTPLCTAIASEFDGGFIILRGYKRASKGLIKICLNGKILTDVLTSGDEAMEYALSVPNANVIVSENREKAINLAIKLGAKYILLDDGFGKFYIDKFDIIIRPEPKPFFKFCLPSGAYRYPLNFAKFANFVAINGRDFTKQSFIINPSKRMVLVTAIANPSRLSEHFGICVAKIFFPDHHAFKKSELEKILAKFSATSLLVTKKDFVKIKDFNLNLSLIALKTTLKGEFKELIRSKIKEKDETNPN